jgi:hypothetical protein
MKELKQLLNRNGFITEKIYGAPVFYKFGGNWLGRTFPELSSIFVIKAKKI